MDPLSKENNSSKWFQVLADRVNLPCKLVKGICYTGTDEGAINFVKIDFDRYVPFIIANYLFVLDLRIFNLLTHKKKSYGAFAVLNILLT